MKHDIDLFGTEAIDNNPSAWLKRGHEIQEALRAKQIEADHQVALKLDCDEKHQTRSQTATNTT